MVELKLGGTAGATQQYIFLGEVQRLIKRTEKVISLLSSRHRDEIDNDTMLDSFEREMSSKGFDTLTHPGAGSQLLRPIGLHWFRYAIGIFTSVTEALTEDARYVSTVDIADVEQRLSMLKTVLGALAFSVLDGFDLIRQIDDEVLLGEFDMSEGIRAFLDDNFGGSPIRMISGLYRMYLDSPPFVPVRLEFPEEWDDFCEMVTDTEFGNEILDYGDDLFLPDVKAIVSGTFPVDESLLSVMRERENNLYTPAKLYPHKFAQFIAFIPDEHANILLLHENRLSEALIDRAIAPDGGVNAQFVKDLADAPTLDTLYADTEVLTGESAYKRMQSLFGEETRVF